MLEILDIGTSMPGRLQSMEDASVELSLSTKDRRMYERFFGLSSFPLDHSQSLLSMTEQAYGRLELPPDATTAEYDLVVHCHTLLSIGPCRSETVLPIHAFSDGRGEVFSATMNHCATGVAVLEMVETLLPDNGLGLVIISDKGFHPVLRLIKNTTIMGESAVAILVGKRPGKFRYVAGHTERLGKYSIMTGRCDEVGEPGFAKEYVDFVATCITRALSRGRLSIGDVRLVLPHNVNLPSWEQISDRIGARPAQVYLKNVPRYGHTFGADPFLNLVDATEEDDLLRPGDHVLLVSVGLGATASCAILRVNEGPEKKETDHQRRVSADV